jgi:hypothetical protein
VLTGRERSDGPRAAHQPDQQVVSSAEFFFDGECGGAVASHGDDRAAQYKRVRDGWWCAAVCGY